MKRISRIFIAIFCALIISSLAQTGAAGSNSGSEIIDQDPNLVLLVFERINSDADLNGYDAENLRKRIINGEVILFVDKDSRNEIVTLGFADRMNYNLIDNPVVTDKIMIKKILGPALEYIIVNNFYSVDKVYEEATKINDKLTKKISATNDKDYWIISDKDFIEEVAQKLESKNMLRLRGRLVNSEYIDDVMASDIALYVKKRSGNFVGNEHIEKIAFFDRSEFDLAEDIRTPLFDEIWSFTQLQDDLNKETYAKLIDRSDWEVIVPPTNYYRHMRIAAFDPEIRFAFENDNQNLDYTKSVYSVFGKWGYDNIPILGYYSNELVLGLRYYVFDLNKGVERESFRVGAGVSFGVDRPFVTINPPENFFNSGVGVYLEGMLSWDLPFENAAVLDDIADYLDFNFGGKFSTEFKKAADYDLNDSTYFYALRNFADLELKFYTKATNLKLVPSLNLGDLTWSIGWNPIDIPRYLHDPRRPDIIDLNPNATHNFKRFDYIWYAKIGLEKPRGLLQHKFEIFLNWNAHRDYQYLGAGLEMMYYDLAGFQIKAAIGIPQKNLQGWSNDYYLIISPIVKLNF